MEELKNFRQFLAEGVTADEITSRVRKLGKEKGIEDKYIEDYIDELDGNFEPDAYENSTDKDLLDDLKSYIDLSEGVINEESFGAAGTDKRSGQVIGEIIQMIRNTGIDPSDVLEEIGQEFGIAFEFGRG